MSEGRTACINGYVYATNHIEKAGHSEVFQRYFLYLICLGSNHFKRKNSEQEARHKVKLLEKLLKYKQEKIRKEKEKIEEEDKLRKIMILKEK